MLAELPWVVLHGTESHAVARFRTVLGALVALLVVVGALWYLGVFGAAGASGDAERDSEPADADSEAGD